MLEARQLTKVYGEGSAAVHALGDITFEVRDGEFLCIVGPSGCGKTTLLRCLSGLMRPTTGETLLRGKPIDGPPAGLAMVFQDYSRSLMPWLKVRDNVAFPLAEQKVNRRERRERADAALQEVGIRGFGDKYPWQLSGGMQQRVAIARAIACRPDVLLMDEPFASVDAQTRADLEDLTLRVQRDLGMTVVFVTHDIDEAVYLGDRVAVLGKPPTRVVEVVEIPLPQPRDQITTKQLPTFADLRADIYGAIRSLQG